MIADPDIDEVFAYWRSIRNGRAMPGKSDLDPINIRKHIPFVSIHERVAPDEFVYRIHGTGLAATAAADHTGTNAFDLVPEVWRNPLMTLLNGVLDHPCGVLEEHLLDNSIRGRLTRVGLHLPLADNAGAPKFVLNYHPPGEEERSRSINTWRAPESQQEVIGFTDLEFIDLGSGLPEFAPQAVEMIRGITKNLLEKTAS
jgi:hypothetical protein